MRTGESCLGYEAWGGRKTKNGSAGRVERAKRWFSNCGIDRLT